LDAAQGRDKRILRNIGGGVAIAKHAQDHVIDSLLVLQHELVECADISLLAAYDELCLIFSQDFCHRAASLLFGLNQCSIVSLFRVLPAFFGLIRGDGLKERSFFNLSRSASQKLFSKKFAQMAFSGVASF
jgi:hypothetical protein